MTSYFSNIRVNSIQNKSSVPYESLKCCICLEIAMNPFECGNCGILICEVCNKLMRLLGKQCVKDRCKNSINKANKHVREVLRLLIITCSYCDLADIKYDDYTDHLKTCLVYNDNENIKNYKKLVSLEVEIEKKTKEKEALYKKLSQPEFSKTGTSTGTILVTNVLKAPEKLELYNATVDGDISSLKNLLVDKNYSIFEEISQPGFKWTSLHYAMHYGKKEVIFFLLDFLLKKGLLHEAIKVQSSDGRCPLLCILKSNNLSAEMKKEIIKEIIKRYKFKISDNIMYEIKKRNMSDILS